MEEEPLTIEEMQSLVELLQSQVKCLESEFEKMIDERDAARRHFELACKKIASNEAMLSRYRSDMHEHSWQAIQVEIMVEANAEKTEYRTSE